VLRDGRVLVSGGDTPIACAHSCGTVSAASAEVYDPATGVWSPTGSMSVARATHLSVTLADGRVLVAGGYARQNEVMGPA
jgi:hypothetical protein